MCGRGYKLRVVSNIECVVLPLVVCVACFAQANQAHAQGANQIALVYQDRKSHHDAAQIVIASLRNSGYSCTPLILSTNRRTSSDDELARRLREANPALVLTAGEQATMIALRAILETPILFFLVPNVLDKSFVQKGSPYHARVGGLTTDIAPEIYFSWFAEVFPEITRLGVLHGVRTSGTVAALQKVASRFGITVQSVPASKRDFAKAIDTLENLKCEGAVMLPDSDVYNPASVQRLLLWGLRKRKPVWGFSSKIVKAGALAGPVASHKHAAEEVVMLAMEILTGRDIGTVGVQYSEPTAYAVNDRTAKMIGAVLSRARFHPETLRFGERR